MDNKTDLLIYQTEDGNTKIDVKLENGTVWMTQKAIAELYQTTSQNITLHIKNVYNENELHQDSTCKEYLQVQVEGSREIKRSIKHYNLEMIISIGYRVRSHRGTQFRRWATERLNEYLVKGFTMDDERLKDMRHFGQDYFDELIQRIRDIRASEKRFYRKITDIYALSIDYDPHTDISKEFFATVQNKLHFAIHGHTAAELIVKRANSDMQNMGLITWKGDKVRKGDVTVAKNYLTDKEIQSLNRIVTMYLDYAEDQAERQSPMYMKDWIDKLNSFLKFNEREILTNAGSISQDIAEKLATSEYEKYNKRRLALDEDNEFDDFIKKNRLKK
ncbi:virulence RhuM family protein [Paenibacillus alba]|uniref:Virulence RhuM family protein n=1 Tax=Paenibacillus alba TaxID=1197127 RepID=A0ABU6G060_9BACL|nr:virulence RhuM family protein [Paenibacillus alba]MEC0227356.1 virulence RhuM family protein [Paenibacillus alba]NQX69862.1 virulence RhuM family protein [Paenibacillus alba]